MRDSTLSVLQPEESSVPQGKAVYILSLSEVSDARERQRGEDSPHAPPLSWGPKQVREAQLAEIRELVRAQGDTVVGEEMRTLTRLHPRTLVGSGACREVAERARARGATMLAVDAELSPSQMRNLEELAGLPVCDREGVILNVFLKHARTRRSRVQVEIARLEYLRPRIRGVGLSMDQQMGGVTGGRGPGETASELMARQLDSRLAELKKQERKFERSEEQQRRHRRECRGIALIGYTNAGKTSLMNALTAETLSARDRPFETLDTTSRTLTRHGQEVLISDTVGFIRRLPDRLLASFESTLAEIRDASLLAIVTDLSDSEWRTHLQTTVEMLERLGADQVPRFHIFTKLDRVDFVPDVREWSPFRLVSSTDPVAVRALKEDLLAVVRRDLPTASLYVPYEAQTALASVYRDCRVLTTHSGDAGLVLTVQAEPRALAAIRGQIP